MLFLNKSYFVTQNHFAIKYIFRTMDVGIEPDPGFFQIPDENSNPKRGAKARIK
jgi:hypothetical protein